MRYIEPIAIALLALAMLLLSFALSQDDSTVSPSNASFIMLAGE